MFARCSYKIEQVVVYYLHISTSVKKTLCQKQYKIGQVKRKLILCLITKKYSYIKGNEKQKIPLNFGIIEYVNSYSPRRIQYTYRVVQNKVYDVI